MEMAKRKDMGCGFRFFDPWREKRLLKRREVKYTVWRFAERNGDHDSTGEDQCDEPGERAAGGQEPDEQLAAHGQRIRQ
jgi:hypothetical protein